MIADTAGTSGYPEHVTARLVYVRLDRWAGKAEAWSREGLDVYIALRLQ